MCQIAAARRHQPKATTQREKDHPDGATEREQSALTGDSHTEWRQTVRDAAAATAGPQFLAKANDGCSHCPMRSGCPAHTAPRTEPS